ncbi:MAG: hypothetical protein P4L77_05110 [Sulfuriferula sp.]|jgi:Rho-binding antiterminator|nr:hypothetical protein [Sulfuriferula sp.]
MSSIYQPVPRFYLERLTIAALCNEAMDLHWHDEPSQMNYMARIWPLEIVEQEHGEFLLARNEAGEQVSIRLDQIRNFPTPVK